MIKQLFSQIHKLDLLFLFARLDFTQTHRHVSNIGWVRKSLKINEK